MKKLTITCVLALTAAAMLSSCSSKRDPGKIYMPDMAYSRAYETYMQRDSAAFTMDESERGGSKIYYDAKTVSGTVKRGDELPMTLPKDTLGYKLSASLVNPIQQMTEQEMTEAGRLYNINCGVCHGAKGEGNGPVSEKVAGVANLLGPIYLTMADGTMFYSVTYGKGVMGSYASQLTRHQRWQVIKYIRNLQAKAAPAATADTTKKG